MTSSTNTWLAPIPRMRDERHYGSRVTQCFAERPLGMPAMLADAVARNAEGEALVCDTQRLSWRQLESAVGRLAGGLASLGVGRGDRVAILLANSIEYVVALHAIMRLGAIAVLLNIREERPELAYILSNSGAVVVIYDAVLAAKIPLPDDVPALRHSISVRGESAGALSYRDVAQSPSAPPVGIAEEEVAAILYTSGTTGRPKGAMITHMGLVHASMIYEACMGLTQQDRSLVSVPLSHVTGLTAAVGVMMRVAGALVVMPQFKADAFIELAARERMTHTVMVPAMYNLCLMTPAFDRADLSAWRIGGYGGAPMPEVTIERLSVKLPGLKLMNAYGSTETTGPVVLMPPSLSVGRRAAVGCAVPPARIRIMDDDGREVAPGESGEVWLEAPNVVPGYWQNPEATADAFVAGSWRSGDLGRLDADGFLTLLDRKKDMINRGGFKIYSVEVENVLAGIPGVVEAAVVAKPCPVLGERVHAFVVVHAAVVTGDGASTPLAETEIKAHCRGRLADYKIPDGVTFLSAPLPRNAAGKVLKRELRDWLG